MSEIDILMDELLKDVEVNVEAEPKVMSKLNRKFKKIYIILKKLSDRKCPKKSQPVWA